MIKFCQGLEFLPLVAIFALPSVSKGKNELEALDNLQFIDAMIGNVGHLLQSTKLTIQLPDQVLRVYPVRQDALDNHISSFSQLIVSCRFGKIFSVHRSIIKSDETEKEHQA